MPTLTLKFKDKMIRDYPLQNGTSLTIGRRDDNDIIIDNLAVSGNHARIDSIGDGFLLTDLKSKNGTFVNEQLIVSQHLKHKDILFVGKHSLVFTYKDSEKQPAEITNDLDHTMMMDTDKYRDMLAKSTPTNNQMTRQNLPDALLSLLFNNKGEVKLSKKLTTIGKDPSSDIMINGFLVGKTAATISKRPKGYYLSYVEGISKPKINGKTVTGSILLKEFDIISIGHARMQFCE